MASITLIAKTLIPDEDTLEATGKYDLGNLANGSVWKWRKTCVSPDEIYTITEYSKTKCLVRLYDDTLLLVEGIYDDLKEQWDKAMEYDYTEQEQTNTEEEE